MYVKTIIDTVTIPLIFLAIVLSHDWLGLLFLHILRLNHVIDLLKIHRIDILLLVHSYFII